MLDLDMAQYGPFVWSAWAISAAVLAAVVWNGLAQAARAKKALRELGDDET